jgi:hypothetical protein
MSSDLKTETTSQVKKAALELWKTILGTLLLVGVFLVSGLVNRMCPVPDNCIEHQLGGGAAVLECR